MGGASSAWEELPTRGRSFPRVGGASHAWEAPRTRMSFLARERAPAGGGVRHSSPLWGSRRRRRSYVAGNSPSSRPGKVVRHDAWIWQRDALGDWRANGGCGLPPVHTPGGEPPRTNFTKLPGATRARARSRRPDARSGQARCASASSSARSESTRRGRQSALRVHAASPKPPPFSTGRRCGRIRRASGHAREERLRLRGRRDRVGAYARARRRCASTARSTRGAMADSG